MGWRITSRTDKGRWAAYDGGKGTADAQTAPILRDLAAAGDQPMLTPTGPAYKPTGPGDETAIYLRALNLIPAPEISGTPPPTPDVPYQPGVAY